MPVNASISVVAESVKLLSSVLLNVADVFVHASFQPPTRETLDRFVHEAVSQDVRLIATDEHSGYRQLGADFNHGVVAHSKGEYVVGAIHTNTIESFWSLLKRGIVGSYHKVSKEHLPAYVAEFEFRFNNRKNPHLFRDTLMRLLSTEPLPFEKLTTKTKAAA